MATRHVKYIKRTGSKGNYKYWYRDSAGNIVSHPDQRVARNDHAKRLVVARERGLHGKTNREIAEEVGGHVTPHAVNRTKQNMNLTKRAGRPGHSYESHHLEEAVVSGSLMAETRDTFAEILDTLTPAPEATAPTPAAVPDRGRFSAAAENKLRRAGWMQDVSPTGEHRWIKDARWVLKKKPLRAGYTVSDLSLTWDTPTYVRGLDDAMAMARTSTAPSEDTVASIIAPGSLAGIISSAPTPAAVPDRGRFSAADEYDLRRAGWMQEVSPTGEHRWIKVKAGIVRWVLKNTSGPDYTIEDAMNRPGEAIYVRGLGEAMDMATVATAAAPATPAVSAKAAKIRKLRKKLKDHGVDLPHDEAIEGPAAAAAPAPITASAARAAVATAASEPAAVAAVAEVEPAFAATERPIRKMVETQAGGGNPYLDRAFEVFNKIKSDVKEERRNKAKYLLATLSEWKAGNISQSEMLGKYKELSGSSRVRTLPWDDFEKATFMTKEEILENPPINIEVERMKRGYSAMQFARMKPYLKDSWHRAYPPQPDGSPPPPMPTFGDVKKWSEHEGGKPEWAGTTRIAVPKEVFDASIKTADGKPQYPPPWMPIHLMPAWSFIVRKAGESNPYAGQKPSIGQSGAISTSSQAAYQEGIALASLRKYVMMRGGAAQLIDIPSHKLAEVGLTHAKIFKAEFLSDAELKEIIRHKIIDVVALVSIIKEGGLEKSLKKSFSLVVSEDERPFEKSRHSEESIKKSLIHQIRRLRNEQKGISYVSRL